MIRRQASGYSCVACGAADAGIVDENIDMAELSQRGVMCALNLVESGNFNRDRTDAPASRPPPPAPVEATREIPFWHAAIAKSE